MKQNLALVAGVALLLVAGSTVLGRALLRREPELHGVRLGMSAAEVRARFDAARAGEFSDSLGCSGAALDWNRTGSSEVRWARFELHDDRVVAIRVQADAADPPAERVEIGADAVVSTAPIDKGYVTIVLSRSCPNHQAELAALLAGK